MKIPSVWSESLEGHVGNILISKAVALSRANTLPANLEDWKRRSVDLRRLVAQHTYIQYEPSLPLDCKVTKTIQCDGYRIQCLHFQSRPAIRTTGCLYVPDGDGPFPAVLNVHGHWSQGHLAERVQARGHSLAKNGFVCLSIDAWGAGERSWSHGNYRYHGNTLGGGLFQYGETLMGAQIADNMRAVDLLRSLPFVDNDNIGVTGASGGGNQTMWLAAMDERIKAAMPVVSVGTFEAYVMSENCVCELLPDGLKFTEEDGILALVAPRYLKICNAMKDSRSFSVEEMLRSYNKAREIFKLYGAEDRFTYQPFNTVHGYWPEIREAMLGFFKMALMGKGNGAAISEIPFATLPEEQIMTFEPGKRPDNFGTIEEYLALKEKSIPKRDISPNNAKSEFEKLAATMRFTPAVQSNQLMQMSDINGWHRCTLMAQDSRAIPIIYKVKGKTSKCAKAYAFSCPTGKASLENTPMLKKALADESAAVILFDAFATGETACDDANKLSPFHKLSRSLLWCGMTLEGEWARDFVSIAAFAHITLGVGEIVFGTVGEMSIAACTAAVAIAVGAANIDGIRQLSVMSQDFPATFAWTNGNDGSLPQGTLARAIPGFSNWGDIPALRKLMKSVDISIQE